ncbi:MAG: serine/threonine-protein phosphatase [Actinomycetota bacterium]|nr:serine/threonine-protein phosphatase [Acidimicrobiia bacterium]MDQ3293225.1 serine/threonine-protein phosphatase [Actinomycetota bacterium]
MDKPILAVVAAGCLIAAVVWGRSARYLRKVEQRLGSETGPSSDATVLARSLFRKELHTSLLYSVIALASLAVSFSSQGEVDVLFAFVLVPVAMALVYGRDFIREARLFEGRSIIERRAEEVLSQEELAPRQWAQRLAPDELPPVAGYDIGRIYQPGTGLLAGDFYDVYPLSATRVAVVIGDVTGHGIEPSITAFQAKELLRVFLHEYRDPGQALEVLNERMSRHARSEEFVSIFVGVLDSDAATVRFASAGHPAGWLWHDRDMQALEATGPLLLLDPNASFHSRELALDVDDLLVVYTDGLAEARAGQSQFGEERIASFIRRDPGVDSQVLCKALVEAARDFSSTPITDDIAVLAVRRL